MEVVSSSVDLNGVVPSGVQFSPDGLCVLTSSRDELRLYNTSIVGPSWKAALTCKSGDIVQSFDWYPYMNSQNQATSCFLATSREQPVHLYDAYTGEIRATYAPYNTERDEPISPLVVKFDCTGTRAICAGFSCSRFIHVFDVARPGKDSLCCYKLGRTRRSQDGQKGLVSSIGCADTSSNVLAVGTYSPGSIFLYDTRVSGPDEVAVVLNGGVSVMGHGRRVKRFASVDDEDKNDIFSVAKSRWLQKRVHAGVTQLQFLQQDHMLLSATRKSDAVVRWDIRMMTTPEHATRSISGVMSYSVNHQTNQRMRFHCHEDVLHVGDLEGNIKVYCVSSGELIDSFKSSDVVNGVSVHTDFVAVSRGERTFGEDRIVCEGGLELWRRCRTAHSTIL